MGPFLDSLGSAVGYFADLVAIPLSDKYEDEAAAVAGLTVELTSADTAMERRRDILNYLNKEVSYINITIVLDKHFINSGETLDLIRKINEISDFDYIYGLNLNEDFDFDTEKKIKKSLFGLFTSASVTKEDIEEEKRKIDFKKGYMKKIYPFNIINENQLSYINQNIKINYHLSKFNDQLYILRQDSSIDQVKK
jgi:hypothetical protein